MDPISAYLEDSKKMDDRQIDGGLKLDQETNLYDDAGFELVQMPDLRKKAAVNWDQLAAEVNAILDRVSDLEGIVRALRVQTTRLQVTLEESRKRESNG